MDQKQKEMSNKVNSAATRMDKIEQKLRCLSEEEAELYRSQLAEIKADFKGSYFFELLRVKLKQRNHDGELGNAA